MPAVAHLQSWQLVPLRLIFEKEKRHGDLTSPHYTRDNKEEEKEPGVPCSGRSVNVDYIRDTRDSLVF